MSLLGRLLGGITGASFAGVLCAAGLAAAETAPDCRSLLLFECQSNPEPFIGSRFYFPSVERYNFTRLTVPNLWFSEAGVNGNSAAGWRAHATVPFRHSYIFVDAYVEPEWV